MERARKPFVFSDGREVTVWESTWETAARRSAMEESARAEKSKLNGSGDPVLFFFVENFYSYLDSCSSGPFPSPEDALSLPDPDLDGWFLSVVEVNPESFLSVDRSREGKVVFRDGSSFRIVSSYLPSVAMKRVRLEEEALRKEEDREKPKDIFAVYLYPVLASCSIGEIPSPEEIRSNWPEGEIYKWRDAVAEVNPHLFQSPEESQAKTLVEEQEIKKKKERPRKR